MRRGIGSGVVDQVAAHALQRGPAAGPQRKASSTASSAWSTSSGSRTSRKTVPRPRSSRAVSHRVPNRQVGGHLPGLGVDEEERDEDQQQRQCARRRRHHRAAGCERALQRPAHDRAARRAVSGVGEGADPAARVSSTRGRGRGLLGEPPQQPREQGAHDDHHRQRGHQPAPGQRLAGGGALGGDEVGQPVLEEPDLGGRERVVRTLAHRHVAGSSRARARRTSSCMVSMSASTPSNLTMPRSRSTNSTSTSTP